MATARTHFLTLPKGFLALRIVQLVTGVLLLCLASYGISYAWGYPGVDLTLFTAICTIIATAYMISAHTVAPVVYNYWAFLGLDIFLIVFWIISFSVLAWDIAVLTFWFDYSSYTTCDYYYYCYRKRSAPLDKRYTTWADYKGAMAAASGFGGLEFILFTISLIMISLALVRHRKAGGHCNATTSPTVQQQPGIAMEPKVYADQQGYPQQGAYAPPGPGQPIYPPPQSYTPAPSYPQTQPVPYQQPQPATYQ